MRVAMIVNAFPGLSEKFILNQVVDLIEAGVEVDIYSAMDAGESKRHELVERFDLMRKVHNVGVPRSLRARVLKLPAVLRASISVSLVGTLRALNPRYATAARNLKTLYFHRAFAGRRYDVVHCHFGPNGLIGAFLKDCGLASRLVVTFHGSDINSYPNRYGTRVYATLYDRADAVTAGSSFIKGKLIANGCPEEKISLLPAGIRIEERSGAPFAQRRPQSILSVGRLVEVKGYRYAVEALTLLRKQFPRLQLEIVGDGPERPELEALASRLGVSPNLRFLGSKSDVEVAELYRQSSVFVLPSIRARDGAEEGQGLVLQEAQAAGLPVVSTKVGGIPEGVRDGCTGFLVDQKDPAALAERIGELLADEGMRERMGRAARDFVVSNYDSKVLTARLLRIYAINADSREY